MLVLQVQLLCLLLQLVSIANQHLGVSDLQWQDRIINFRLAHSMCVAFGSAQVLSHMVSQSQSQVVWCRSW